MNNNKEAFQKSSIANCGKHGHDHCTGKKSRLRALHFHICANGLLETTLWKMRNPYSLSKPSFLIQWTSWNLWRFLAKEVQILARFGEFLCSMSWTETEIGARQWGQRGGEGVTLRPWLFGHSVHGPWIQKACNMICVFKGEERREYNFGSIILSSSGPYSSERGLWQRIKSGVHLLTQSHPATYLQHCTAYVLSTE